MNRKPTIGVALAIALSVFMAAFAHADAGQYVMSVAKNGDVQQTFTATGTVSRENTVTAEMEASGKVKSVKVSLGEKVSAGQTLAIADSTALKLALLTAQEGLADAEAALYSAKHPASSGGSAAKMPTGGAANSGSAGSAGGSAAISAADLKTLYAAIAEVTRVSALWSSAGKKGAQPTMCDQVYAALRTDDGQTPTPEPTAVPTETPSEPVPDPTQVPTADPADTPTPSPTQTSAAATPTPTVDPTSSATVTPTPSATSPTPDITPSAAKAVASPNTSDLETGIAPVAPASALALVAEDIGLQELQTCGKLRSQLAIATAKLAGYYQQLITTGKIGGGAAGGDAKGAGNNAPTGASAAAGASASAAAQAAAQAMSRGASKSTGAKTSSTSTTSKTAIARAEAEVLRAEQEVDTAQENLEKAELATPIAGVIGALSLAVGQSGGSATIVGEGNAELSVELPLKIRELVAVGQEVAVTTADAAEPLSGKLTQISQLETSGTAGDNPTYAAKVSVSDLGGQLLDGARASAIFVTKDSTDVLLIPASALTPTGDGVGEVQVLDSVGNPQTLSVKYGAVGQGYAEITEGLNAGQEVVLADKSAPLPSNNTR